MKKFIFILLLSFSISSISVNIFPTDLISNRQNKDSDNSITDNDDSITDHEDSTITKLIYNTIIDWLEPPSPEKYLFNTNDSIFIELIYSNIAGWLKSSLPEKDLFNIKVLNNKELSEFICNKIKESPDSLENFKTGLNELNNDIKVGNNFIYNEKAKFKYKKIEEIMIKLENPLNKIELEKLLQLLSELANYHTNN